MNKEQWGLLESYFTTLYDTGEKLDNLNEIVDDPKIHKAIEQILDGLDIIAEILIEHEEAEKAKE